MTVAGLGLTDTTSYPSFHNAPQADAVFFASDSILGFVYSLISGFSSSSAQRDPQVFQIHWFCRLRK